MDSHPMDQISVPCPLSGASAVERFSIQQTELIELYRFKRGINLDDELDVPEVTYHESPEIDFGFFWSFRAGSKHFYQQLTARPKCRPEKNRPEKNRPEKKEYALAARYVADGARVLDVGCGWGWLRKYVATAEYTGLEMSDEAANVCRERRIEVVRETIAQHALHHQERHDVVRAFQVLEHVEDPLGFVAAMAKRSRGRVVPSVPNKHSLLERLDQSLPQSPSTPHQLVEYSGATPCASKLDPEIEHLEEEAAMKDAWCYSALAVQGWLPKRPIVDVSMSGRVLSFLARGSYTRWAAGSPTRVCCATTALPRY
jgi:SAM-dependent methyltransferase